MASLKHHAIGIFVGFLSNFLSTVVKTVFSLDKWTRKHVSLGVPLKLLLFSYRRFAALSLLINAPKNSHSELSSLCNSRTVETPCDDVFEPDFCLNLPTYPQKDCFEHKKGHERTLRQRPIQTDASVSRRECVS